MVLYTFVFSLYNNHVRLSLEHYCTSATCVLINMEEQMTDEYLDRP
jgi:hypothetical protein